MVGARRSSAGTVVLVHGLNRSRIEMVRRCPSSTRRAGTRCSSTCATTARAAATATTFGFFEKEDVQAAARFARERSPGPVVLWGVSLGGAAVVLAAAEDPDVAGVVCDSSYRSLRDTVAPPPGPLPPLPLVAAPRARLAGRGRRALLDRPPRRASTPSRWTSWRPPRTSGPAGAVRGQLRATGACRRRSPSTLKAAVGDTRRGAGRAGQEPRRRLARRHRGLPRPRPWCWRRPRPARTRASRRHQPGDAARETRQAK